MDTKLLQKLGNMEQLAGVREVVLAGGAAKGMAALEFYNAAGLRFTVLPDRCMDIYDFSYKGCNFAYLSKNGLMPAGSPAEDEFFHRWPGGMLATCGLANVGDACEDGGVHPVHGRIGATPARHVCVQAAWQGEEYVLSASGEMWETRLYGRQLSLRRTISVGLYGKTVRIEDKLVNHGGADEEYMLLYHFNYGYPLLDEGSVFHCPDTEVRPRTQQAKDPVHMSAPGGEEPHQLFLHEPKGLRAKAALWNPSLALGGMVAFSTLNLPYYCEWKHMQPHDYVLAVEPCNCLGLGRVKERENGTLQVIGAYSALVNVLEVGVLDGEAELAGV